MFDAFVPRMVRVTLKYQQRGLRLMKWDVVMMSPVQGLSSEEAATRLAQIGPNAVVEPHLSPVVRIARRFWEPVPWMLEAAIDLQLAIGERVEPLIIGVLLILNVALGVIQEGRAGEALAALKSKFALSAFVRRDGQWLGIPAAGLVPGDIVRLALSGVVPADARVLNGSVLLDQSMLTGESVAVAIGAGKTAYASALVRRGAATAATVAAAIGLEGRFVRPGPSPIALDLKTLPSMRAFFLRTNSGW